MELSPGIIEIKRKFQALSAKVLGQDNAGYENPKKAGSHTPVLMKPIINILGKHSFTNEKLLGVEISPHYIRICQMKSSYARWSLNHLASTCMETQFTNMDIQLNADSYAENLKALLEKHHIKTTDAALSIPTSASIIKIINMPDMEEEDLASAAAMGGIWESMVQLNGSIHEYSVYYKLLRRKVKPSESLAIKETSLLSEISSLDNLLSAAEPSTPPGNVDLSNLLGESESPEPEVNLDLGSILGQPAEIQTQETTPTTDVEVQINIGNEDGQKPVAHTELVPPVSIEAQPEITAQVPEEIIPEEEANTMDVLFVAAKKSDIALYTSIAERAGLKPIIVDTKANSLKHAFDTNPDRRNIPYPCALLEFGADENYIYIMEEHSVATYNIAISEEDRQLMAHHEENPEALRGFTERYAQQLQTILSNYSKQRKSANKVYNIYVSSSTPLHVEDASSEPLIHTFIEFMSELMGSTKILPCTFCNHIEVPAEFAKKVNAEGNLSAWANVLGLATYKLDIFDHNKDGDAIDRVNLLPDAGSIKHIRSTQMLSTLAMAAVFAFVTIISGVSYSMLLANGSNISAQISGLKNVKGEYEGKNQELQKLSLVMSNVKSLDSVRSGIPSNQTQILTVYKNIANAIPEGVWLSDVNFTAPKDVEIKGNSINDQNILEFVNKLNETGGFQKVSLKTMAIQEAKPNDKSATAPTGMSANVKKFTLQGDLMRDAKAEKLELLSGGVK